VTAARAPASRVVLVHGAWHGAWCWERVVPLLAERGLQATCIDLPGHGADSGSLGDLHADAAAVRAVLDAAPGPVVLVGHSYGGAVITEAAAGCRALADLVYLAAFMIDDSESVVGVSAGPASAATAELGARALRVAPDGVTTTIDPGLAAELFYADCTPADAAAAAARLGPQLISTLTQCPRGVAGGSTRRRTSSAATTAAWRRSCSDSWPDAPGRWSSWRGAPTHRSCPGPPRSRS